MPLLGYQDHHRLLLPCRNSRNNSSSTCGNIALSVFLQKLVLFPLLGPNMLSAASAVT